MTTLLFFDATQGGMAVTVFKQAEQKAAEPTNVGVNQLLAYIQTHPGMRVSDVATEYKVTPRTIERPLKQLNAEGKIEFKGAPKTGGYYATPGDQP